MARKQFWRRNNKKPSGKPKKRWGRSYTPEEKYAYHKSREKESYYSQFWVMGFTDPHAKENLQASKNALRRIHADMRRSGRKFDEDEVIVRASRNGRAAAVSLGNAARKYERG